MGARYLSILTAAAFAMAGGMAGCVSQGDILADQGHLLTAAGFTARPANTPERADSLRKLPPGQVVQETRGDQFAYVMADPVVCNCLYTGDAAAYGRYQQELFQRNIASQQLAAAQLNQDAWDWGPWGPYWGPPSGVFLGYEGYYGGGRRFRGGGHFHGPR